MIKSFSPSLLKKVHFPSSILTGHSSETSCCCSDVSESQRVAKTGIKLSTPIQFKPDMPRLGTENSSAESMQMSAKPRTLENSVLFKQRTSYCN